jgi:hypothetical protein
VGHWRVDDTDCLHVGGLVQQLEDVIALCWFATEVFRSFLGLCGENGGGRRWCSCRGVLDVGLGRIHLMVLEMRLNFDALELFLLLLGRCFVLNLGRLRSGLNFDHELRIEAVLVSSF